VERKTGSTKTVLVRLLTERAPNHSLRPQRDEAFPLNVSRWCKKERNRYRSRVTKRRGLQDAMGREEQGGMGTFRDG